MERVIGTAVLLGAVAFALGRARDASLTKRIGREARKQEDHQDPLKS